MALQSQRDCVLQPRVAESARLPWVSVRAIFNPNGVVSPLDHRATTQQFFQVTSMDPVLLQPDTGKRLYQRIAGLSFRLPQKVIRPCHVR